MYEDKEEILRLWKNYERDWEKYDQQKSKKIIDISDKVIKLKESIELLVCVVLQKIQTTVSEKNTTIANLIDYAG